LPNHVHEDGINACLDAVLLSDGRWGKRREECNSVGQNAHGQKHLEWISTKKHGGRRFCKQQVREALSYDALRA